MSAPTVGDALACVGWLAWMVEVVAPTVGGQAALTKWPGVAPLPPAPIPGLLPRNRADNGPHPDFAEAYLRWENVKGLYELATNAERVKCVSAAKPVLERVVGKRVMSKQEWAEFIGFLGDAQAPGLPPCWMVGIFTTYTRGSKTVLEPTERTGVSIRSTHDIQGAPTSTLEKYAAEAESLLPPWVMEAVKAELTVRYVKEPANDLKTMTGRVASTQANPQNILRPGAPLLPDYAAEDTLMTVEMGKVWQTLCDSLEQSRVHLDVDDGSLAVSEVSLSDVSKGLVNLAAEGLRR